jgi:ribosomal protein S25
MEHEQLKAKILDFVKVQKIITSPEDVSQKFGIAWVTAKLILLELCAEEKVTALKTSRGLLFEANKEVVEA